MRTYQKEIIIVSITILVTFFAVWHFFGKLEEEKQTVDIDLYSLVAPNPNALIAVNRPSIFSRLILSQTAMQDIISQHIPDIFLSIIEACPTQSSLLFSIHPQGVVFLAKADAKSLVQIEKKAISPLFNTYKPQHQVKENITFNYLPDTENRFFGYYLHNGFLVASYSKKLLEEVASKQMDFLAWIPSEITMAANAFDSNAPMNILFQADSLNLYTSITDSTEWRIQNQWLAADIFTSEGNICCYGSYPLSEQTDTLYQSMADTLSLRLKELYPHLNITAQIDTDKAYMYYTACHSSIQTDSLVLH
ncbi:hypothetical protein [Parabacteroides sp. PF5-9]|uniref:hypothetical protein n=1 Tax=Parabacteroides sp. PF5-9 TaxID=1742404 RepID=UPI0024742B91|nr:hypothetical protein [Parabacteroides sp. PF5-9]MDH6357394.1 hypothetical protein [Parabacteroides sp. PF5-9]